MSRQRRGALLEAVIGVKRPLASAGGGLGIQPVGREHHEDEVGEELSPAAAILWFHTCRSNISVRQEDGDASLRPERGEHTECFCSGGGPRLCSLLCRACLLNRSAFDS